ncbi:glycosyltransferase family 4 protein [Pontiella sulfatireligans]|uniref:N-acetyl-alpha-D-glucosaminyl L-malate synthase n=1 Tax=Pontiella sulfatireligans TaxID=2750658 RepID=A0A6C2UDI0_9BACT|nr:glycosyltransferase family 4 protein [Pontiella sulfatireligans]VGO18262.1 N-acetyl-alpha-D-glucosaminyl L-malate synthase [Pontiella sulfatireligans]
MKRIKIALVASYPASLVLLPDRLKPKYRNRPEHAAPWVRSLTSALVKRDDVEFRVFSHSRAMSSVQNGEENGAKYTFIPKYEPVRIGNYHFHLPARLQFRKHIKAFAPDLVHGFGTESAYGLIASEQGLPSIVFIQGIQAKLAPYYDQFSFAQKWLRQHFERKVVNRASGLVAETKFAEDWAQSMRPEVQVAVIPHAVNPEFFKVNAQYAVDECLCIGTLNRTKAVDMAIRSLAATKNRGLKLSVIGSGPLAGEMKGLAEELGVSERVKFCGHLNRDQIIERMSKARMLAILSRMDTSPNILTEAHAAGLPVIGTRAGGIPDMIDDGKDGFLVDVDDFHSAAGKMDHLSGNPDLCRQMGQTGREKVRWLNEPDRIADLHVDFYRNILGL